MWIGNVYIETPLTLAPMAGQTNHAFRSMCREMKVLLGDRREDRAFKADHRANERVDQDKKGKLRQVCQDTELWSYRT